MQRLYDVRRVHATARIAYGSNNNEETPECPVSHVEANFSRFGASPTSAAMRTSARQWKR